MRTKRVNQQFILKWSKLMKTIILAHISITNKTVVEFTPNTDFSLIICYLYNQKQNQINHNITLQLCSSVAVHLDN